MDRNPQPKAWPVHIKLRHEEKILEVAFEEGHHFLYTAEYLRIESPSAEVKGHGSSQRRIISGKRHVGIKSVEPIGNYAIRVNFDDQHDTGIYSWDYLYELGEKQDENWQRYLKMLETLGLSRDPGN